MHQVNNFVVYIAGKFRGANHWEQEQNIRAAESLALECWRRGYVAMCPHLNTRYFQGALPDDVWMEGDIYLLRKCDALLTVDNWENSIGACREVAEARLIAMPVCHSLDAVDEVYSNGASPALF